MRTLIHADIFFFIATIAVIIISIVLAIAGFYVIRILKNMHEISEKVKNESEEIIDDVKELRKKIREEGASFRGIGKMLGFFARKKK